MTQAIQGRKVAFLATDGVEEIELRLVTSRGPDDLPAFCSTLIGEIAAGRSSR